MPFGALESVDTPASSPHHRGLWPTYHPTTNLPLQDVPAYTAFDARWGWRVSKQMEISLAGRNLLDRDHAEFGPVVSRGYFRRAAFLKLLWRER